MDSAADAEPGLLAEFAGLLQQVSMEQNILDRFVWMGDIKGVFSIKYCVEHFTDKKPSSMPSDIVISINHLWNVNVPHNFLIFGWSFLLNRIPTKDQLFNRGILSEARDLCCVYYSTKLVTLSHLFRCCSHSIGIQNKVYEWIRILVDLSLANFVGFFLHCGKVECSSQRTIMAIIWVAMVWSLWITRNAINFKEGVFIFYDCMSAIVLRSWK